MTAIREPGDLSFRTLRSPAPPARSRPSPADRRTWRQPVLLFWAGIGVTAIVLACVADVIVLVSQWTRFDLVGSYSLTTDVTDSANGGCEGNSSYGDIAEGTPVVVYDPQGAELGRGALAGSFDRRGVCFFEFAVRNVPGGHDFYQVEVSRRGRLTVAKDDARSGVAFRLG